MSAFTQNHFILQEMENEKKYKAQQKCNHTKFDCLNKKLEEAKLLEKKEKKEKLERLNTII